MRQNHKQKLLNSISSVYEESKDSKLEESIFLKVKSDLNFLSKYFGTTNHQSFLIAIVLTLNYEGATVQIKDLIQHFNCNPMRLLMYNKEFEHLIQLRIFEKQKNKYNLNLAGYKDEFIVNEKVTEAILNGDDMPDIQEEKVNNILELLERLYTLGEKRDNDEISTIKLFLKTEEIFLAYENYELIKRLNTMNMDPSHRYVYLYVIWKTLSGSDLIDLGRMVEGIFDRATSRVRYMQDIQSGKNDLIKNKLIEVQEGRFYNDTEIKLTNYSTQLLKECGINIYKNENKREGLIQPLKIISKELIFSESELNQILLLKGLLFDSKFSETQQRLTDRKLPKGLTALLHGASGTGKTEIVKQIAKETNREIMKVEISKSKSMWFGESEKIIKGIFTNYQAFAEESERTPILLFNEADAIISKRKEIGGSDVKQTENAIQNIILEELENFQGILIATTNLVTNLDSAFQRRFLFKIQFEKPDVSVRAKIWGLKFPHLSFEECKLLADQFEFSGGEIENILRKKELHEVLYGESVTLAKLLVFCSEETLLHSQSKIGFSKV